MNSLKSKKIFLVLSVTVPFMLYCFYYYGMMVSNAPYRFADFQSIQFQFGYKDSLLNKYDSKTGDYQYLNRKGSLVKMHLHLTNDDLLDLHRNAADLGFWNFPANETVNDSKVRAPRYIIIFNYKQKSKKVVFDANYDGPEKLVDANQRLIKKLQKTLLEAEQRQKK
ncbi:hypothetical protein [Mucilaginibacter psychrotolerans]|uniref:Uncharacterized protein n=1 Tax=Mucilaginibacter psychrotolerans TaxID=1524096 RepID=A0A4Y8SKW4_9SPHI|nr:hypothetical protein [Mucilaginibacter psychrotolerans]TFF39699.1 hypothetical protein E2R66_04855 [Mucilaginibacter psychrotolerans]